MLETTASFSNKNKTNEIASKLFSSALQPYLAMLSRWLFWGEVAASEDTFKEIQFSKLSDTAIWNVLRDRDVGTGLDALRGQVPIFLHSRFSSILKTGHLVSLIRINKGRKFHRFVPSTTTNIFNVNFSFQKSRNEKQVSEQSEQVLRKTRILAMNPAKWLQP